MHTQQRRSMFSIAFAIFGVGLLAGTAAGETITATAVMKTAGGVNASAPVEIRIDRLSTDRERDEVVAALKQRGTAGVRELLQARDQLGSVHVGTTNTPIKFAYVRTTADGRLITVVTGSPIAFIGAGVPGAKPQAGFDLGLVLLEVAAKGPGKGELAPATRVRINEQGAIVTDEYTKDIVQLSNVIGK